MATSNTSAPSLRSVIVVDPSFASYRELAAEARHGRIDLHMRSNGAAALKLAGKVMPDAWIVADELDDMSGSDFVELLRGQSGISGPVWFTAKADVVQAALGIDMKAVHLALSSGEIEGLVAGTAITSVSMRQSLGKVLALPAAVLGLATHRLISALRAD